MPFIDLADIPPISPVPGCRMRTPFGEHLMLSYLEMDDGAEVPLHHHPHEQGGILLKGRVQLTIGDETRVVEAGSLFLIPPTPRTARWPWEGRQWCSTCSARYARIMHGW